MIGEPPSSNGVLYDNVHVSGVMSDTSNGPCGGDGRSTTKTRHDAESVPSELVNEMVYVPVSLLLAALFTKRVSLLSVSNLMRSSVSTLSPLIAHDTFGFGLLVNGTEILNSLPAMTVISRMLRSDVIFGADGGARQAIVSDDGDHGP